MPDNRNFFVVVGSARTRHRGARAARLYAEHLRRRGLKPYLENEAGQDFHWWPPTT